jgi:hypothetical protein
MVPMTLHLTCGLLLIVFLLPTLRKHYEEMVQQYKPQSDGFDARFGHETVL